MRYWSRGGLASPQGTEDGQGLPIGGSPKGPRLIPLIYMQGMAVYAFLSSESGGGKMLVFSMACVFSPPPPPPPPCMFCIVGCKNCIASPQWTKIVNLLSKIVMLKNLVISSSYAISPCFVKFFIDKKRHSCTCQDCLTAEKT